MNLTELKNSLSKIDLSKFDNTQLETGTVICAKTFVSTHVKYVERNRDNPTFKPYYDRLIEFHDKIA